MPETVESIARRLAERRAGLAEANIQADVAAFLRLADLDLDTEDLRLESPAADRRRIDIELGRTVIEIKRNLQRTDLRQQGESQLIDYLGDREAETGARYVGVLTDGKQWLLYRLGDGNVLKEVADYTNRGHAYELVLWLEGALASKQDIAPTPAEIEHRMGVDSTSYKLDFASLLDVYSTCSSNPEVAVKRQLWKRLMSDALGKGFSGMSADDQDLLFVRHTYLVAVAEVLAHLVIGAEIESVDPQHLMSGAIFRQLQISGVVEADFFDWVTDTEEGCGFIRTLARRLARFDFAEPSHDVLKVLYESVIDSDTRHSLGEYYTPDWLAEQIVGLTVDEPLTQTVLDPACGSGTFLFWSVRKVLEACEDSGMATGEAIEEATRRVIGIDLHPVAVTLARVTVLLAVGRQRLQERRSLAVQVYLGDSMMWRQPDDLHGVGGLTVFTSDGESLFADQITLPEELLSDMEQFDRLLSDLTQKATAREPGTSHPSIAGVMTGRGIGASERPAVQAAYEVLCRLHDERRNHIWGYYIRNLARPFYLAKKKVDRLVGNPPWLAYRYMDPDLKDIFKKASKRRNLWVGGTQATHQDLAGYFVARSVERFLPVGGRFAFVMPAGVLKGRQYAGFRTGNWSAQDEQVNHADLTLRDPWRLVDVKPDPFPVPSCVVFGTRSEIYAALPRKVEDWHARLPATGNLRWSVVGPRVTRSEGQVRIATGEGSPYRAEFTQGANLVPLMLLFVEEDTSAPAIGAGAGNRAVRSYRTSQENAPWRDLDSLQGNIESRFIRPTFLGRSVLPYRLGNPLESIIPSDGSQLLYGEHSELDLYPGLASWWRTAERTRSAYAPDGLDLNEQIDYRGKLSHQLPGLPLRVVYSASGTNLAAAILDDDQGIVEHSLYWAPVSSLVEGRYLCGILNSSVLLDEIQDYQPVGQFGPRHFDKYVFEPPFPRYDSGNETHRALAEAVETAEAVATGVAIDGLRFQAARSMIREVLKTNGVASRIDELVLDVLTTPDQEAT